ncbi:hypothetical protein N658DRAFT_558030 [Parathielavia hyrcaniae]|uniref:RRM domain-containing protein n=1 Tax=Parathielavia hyrcaniae TaxID=113614 RepID=A0AAN6Q934_9PEZI|nr:hypothetical protein N658DRAFT_558030 [Parathielavia hyrcaniae]
MAQTLDTEERLPLSSGVGWEWGVTSDFVRIPQPLMGFYWNLPTDAPCVFSKKKAKRSLDRGTAGSRRRVAWNEQQIRQQVASLRARHGSKTQAVVRPKTWEDMYQYFDTVELWYHGAWNLWRVLQLICDENEVGIVKDGLDVEVFNELDDWAYDWCTLLENRVRLSRWDERSDILQVLSDPDHEMIHGCTPGALDVLRGALKYWHHEYKQPPQGQDAQASRAVSLGYEDMAEGRPSRPRARDDNDISLSGETTGPLAHGRPRRRSNSLPPPAIETSTDTSDFVYSAHSTVVIANGTTPVKAQQPLQDLGSAAAGPRVPSRRGHHASRSGPVSPIPARRSSARRAAGVENSGPSRLPSRSQQAVEPATGVPETQATVRDEASGLATQQPSAPHDTFNHGSPNGFPVARNGNQQPSATRNNFTQPRPTGSQFTRNVTSASPCRNMHVRHGLMASYQVCPCLRCMQSSRSVHVFVIPNGEAGAGTGTTQITASLIRYFSQWGYVENCVLKHTAAGRRYAYVTYTSEDSAVRAVTAAQDQPINAPYLNGARVDHTYYSRHFRSPKHRPAANGSHPVTDNETPSAGGRGNSRVVGPREARQSGPQPSTSSQRQKQASRTVRWSPNNSPTVRRTPPRHANQQMPAPGQTMSGGGRTRPPRRLQAPANTPTGYPVASHQEQGPFDAHYYQGHPSLASGMSPSRVPYGQTSHGPYGTSPHNGWRLPVPMPFAPNPLPGTAVNYHAAGFEQAGWHGFPAPPEQSATNGPHQPQRFPGSSEASVQTKPPSEEAAFDDQSSPTESAASHQGHSATGSTSIRVSLPDTTTPEPSEPAVTIPNGARVRDDSSVLRITFGDFVPPETVSTLPTSERAEPANSASPHEINGHHAAQNPLTAAHVHETHHGRFEHAPPQQFTNGYHGADQNPDSATNGVPNPTGAGLESRLSSLSSVSRNSGDVRLDADYNGTVLRRRPFGQNHQLPWSDGYRSGYSGPWGDGPQAPYPGLPSPPVQHGLYRQPSSGGFQPLDTPSHHPSREHHLPLPSGSSQQQSAFSAQAAQSNLDFSGQADGHGHGHGPGPSNPKAKKKNKKKKASQAAPASSQTHSRASTPLPEEALAGDDDGTHQAAEQGAMPAPPSGLADNGATAANGGQPVAGPPTAPADLGGAGHGAKSEKAERSFEDGCDEGDGDSKVEKLVSGAKGRKGGGPKAAKVDRADSIRGGVVVNQDMVEPETEPRVVVEVNDEKKQARENGEYKAEKPAVSQPAKDEKKTARKGHGGGYRAEAGGSLQISRQRVVGRGKAAPRVDVRDVFKDHE